MLGGTSSYYRALIFSLIHVETLQHMMMLSRYHGRNQDYIYEFSLVYVEGIKVSPCQGWDLSCISFSDYS